MKRHKNPCIHKLHKLSAAQPGASWNEAGEKLSALRRFIADSRSVADGLVHIVEKLRRTNVPDKVPAVFSVVEDNRAFLKTALHDSADIVFRDFASYSGQKALMVYVHGLVNKELLDRDVIHTFTANFEQLKAQSSFDRHEVRKLFAVASLADTQQLSEVLEAILDGNTAVFIDGLATAFIVDVRAWEKRAVAEPDTEAVVRGPREGFVETVNINLTLLRRKLKNPNLVFEEYTLGKQTNTLVYVAYLDGIVNREVLQEVKTRLNRIDTDSILETGYIEQFIEESWLSPLATVGQTQKPDIVAAKLLEGRVAIFCDGTPHALTIPNLFVEAIQTPEDYYMRPWMATLLRLIRIIAVFVGIFTPGVYVALETYHQEMLPTVLLLRMAGSMEGVPFPSALETFIMVLFYELLRESGTRLPRPIGSAVSIVGALIIGEGAVNAGLVSATTVIVIALTAVASFIVPALTEVMTIYRFFFLILGGVMGLYGITCGIFLVLSQAVSLRSFGVPYTSTIAPMHTSGLKDFIPRFPLPFMKLRPPFLTKKNVKRRGPRAGK